VGIWYNNLPEKPWFGLQTETVPSITLLGFSQSTQRETNYSTIPIWSTNVSATKSNTTTINVIAQLSDVANLVLILNNTKTKTLIWQSFDHPTDTLIPYLRIGFDRRANQSWFLQSWKTDDDPGWNRFLYTEIQQY